MHRQDGRGLRRPCQRVNFHEIFLKDVADLAAFPVRV